MRHSGGVAQPLDLIDAVGSDGIAVHLLQRDDVGIDPFGAISSGALLIGCTAGTTRTIVDALATRGIVAAQIGTVRSGRVEGRSSEVRLRRDDSWEALPQFSVDEIARLFTETS